LTRPPTDLAVTGLCRPRAAASAPPAPPSPPVVSEPGSSTRAGPDQDHSRPTAGLSPALVAVRVSDVEAVRAHDFVRKFVASGKRKCRSAL